MSDQLWLGILLSVHLSCLTWVGAHAVWLPRVSPGFAGGGANRDPVSRLARLAWAWAFWDWPLSPAWGPCTLPRQLPPGRRGLCWPWCLPLRTEGTSSLASLHQTQR